ncbi:MAG: flagellar M-ring protein FliF C-terminal domain-containing protein [Lachnospiraceae bacterium]|nr:flagellar M-ring protein FliF C-terminal domain-containing protein [Lachnospiraceae bacterium]
MPEQLQKILDRILEWWKKFNNKQRAIMISIAAVVIMALGILGYVVSRPSYVSIYSAEDMKEASSISKLLSDNGIAYNTINGGMTFQVDEKNEATACYLLAENDYPSLTYDISNVTSGSFSTTEADKQKLWKDYLEKKFADHLTQFDFVKSANVDITLPDNNGTILASQDQGTAAVQLFLKHDIDSDQAYGLALFVATELGNDDTKGITILDQDSNVLYSGSDEGTAYGVANSQLNNTQKMSAIIKDEVRDVLLGTQMFSNIEVAMRLTVDYSDTTTATHEYYGNDPDSNTNMIGEISQYSAESNGGAGAIPGTDSNDDTTYYIDDNGNVYYAVDDSDIVYQNNEKVITETRPGGVIDYEKSSIAIVATRYVTYSEEVLEDSGELDDMTFAEFKAAHSEPTAVEVDDSFVPLIANATGVDAESISFACYEQPVFVEKERGIRSVTDILQIVLAVLIFALLGYVVFRSTRRSAETEMEPELSVETLLESTAEEQSALDDIGYSEKSETRILIEKFVDENPDAVALLLRNWLNEDWE